MDQLSAEQIVNIEIQLLQSPGKTLTTLHKHLLGPSNSNQIKILSQFDKKHLSLKLRKMITANVQSMGTDPNANLRAFSIIVLKLIFGKKVDEQILEILKVHLHSNSTNMAKITNISKQSIYRDIGSLSNIEQKKILVEFLHSFQCSFSTQNKIQTQCKKYPLALELLVILWRTVLAKLKVPEAEDYSKKISTTAAYEILFEFLDVFYCKSGRLYLLRDENLFIQNGYENDKNEFVEDITFGNYYENEDQYMKAMLKNMSSTLVAGENFKIVQPNRNIGQFNFKSQNSNQSCVNVNPFQLVLPKGSSIFDSTHSHNSNRSLKGSNAFEKKYFNFSSNRSEASVNLEDSRGDNPTPSFNQVIEDQAHNSFQPQDQSIHITNNRLNRDQIYVMKESATILPVKNKILQSSLLEDLKLFQQSQKGSIQLQSSIKDALGLKNTNEFSGFQTSDSPVNYTLGNSPFEDIVQKSLREENLLNESRKFEKISNQERKSMKRSQSEKKSILKQSQIKQEETIRQSLFSINCKKLKTSMQLHELDLESQQKFSYRDAQEFNEQNNKNDCKHTNYSCSCHTVKLQKNHLVSNTYNLAYQPLSLQQIDFRKKLNNKKIEIKINQNSINQNKSKLNDDFFRKLKAKRGEEKATNHSPKNKSDPKCIEEKSQRKPYFTKYSQFVKKPDEKSVSKSKTPNKSERPAIKQIFSANMKKNQTFFLKSPDPKSGLNNFEQDKKDNKNVNQKNISNKTFASQKVINQAQIETRNIPYPQLRNVTSSFEARGQHLFSSPTTPAARNQNMEMRVKTNMNDSFERSPHFESVNQGKRKVSFNFFSPKSSNGFGKNDNLFYNADVEKGEKRK